MKKPTILLDVDGVLADFASPVLAAGNAHAGTRFEYRDVTSHDIFEQWPVETQLFLKEQLLVAESFWLGLEPYELPDSLREDFNLVACTAPWQPCKTWGWARTKWLWDHHNILQVHITLDKVRVAGQALVEDHLDTAWKWAAAHPTATAFLIDCPWNQVSASAAAAVPTNLLRIQTLDAVVEYYG